MSSYHQISITTYDVHKALGAEKLGDIVISDTKVMGGIWNVQTLTFVTPEGHMRTRTVCGGIPLLHEKSVSDFVGQPVRLTNKEETK